MKASVPSVLRIADSRVKNCRTYIIDFQFSQILGKGPGYQAAITLPKTVLPRPREGVTTFDPYSWDVLCLAYVLKVFARVSLPAIKIMDGS